MPTQLDLGFVMVWVDDVRRTVKFYEALGLKQRFLVDTPDGEYAELGAELGGPGWAEGTTTLAFSSSREAANIVPEGVVTTPKEQRRNPVQLRFIIDDVNAAYEIALKAGAESVSAPEIQPWGLTLARFRDPNGILLSIVSRLAPQNQARRLHELAGPAAVEVLRNPGTAGQLSLNNLSLGQPATPQGSNQLEQLLGQLSDEDLGRIFAAGPMAAIEAHLIAQL